jgi:hypothetical protein
MTERQKRKMKQEDRDSNAERKMLNPNFIAKGSGSCQTSPWSIERGIGVEKAEKGEREEGVRGRPCPALRQGRRILSDGRGR